MPILLLETHIGSSCRVGLRNVRKNWWYGCRGFHKISDKLESDNTEDHKNAKDLHEVGLVVVEEDAESNGENFPGCDNKRHKMLSELFDHPVDEHLADEC